MTSHPVPHPPVRLWPGTLIDIADLLQADRFELIGDDVTFEAQCGADVRRWHGRLGDQLVADGCGYWRIVAAEPWTPLSLWSSAGPLAEPEAAA